MFFSSHNSKRLNGVFELLSWTEFSFHALYCFSSLSCSFGCVVSVSVWRLYLTVQSCWASVQITSDLLAATAAFVIQFNWALCPKQLTCMSVSCSTARSPSPRGEPHSIILHAHETAGHCCFHCWVFFFTLQPHALDSLRFAIMFVLCYFLALQLSKYPNPKTMSAVLLCASQYANSYNWH